MNPLSHIPDEAVEAVARSLYGESEYDALASSQVKAAYRRRARSLLELAAAAAQNAAEGFPNSVSK